MEGEEIISVSLKRSAQEVYDYLKDKSKDDDVLKCLEQEILSKKDPTQVESFNPDMKVSFYYDEYYGSFEKHFKSTLEDFLLVRTINPMFSFGDCVGKHSEVDCYANEFGYKVGKKYEHLFDWREEAQLSDETDDQIIERLEAFIADLCRKEGPFSGESLTEEKMGELVKKCKEAYFNIEKRFCEEEN